ncbi:thermonuclease family protein [Maritimibacter sp. DP1N21-5]|uniref:thermonuclease family protein n=1 Tax=Maritimibacter sp. DP1N21-5 TaxID=2836867 RepID=UPI001C458EDD|nr:thermonuclease family protein [Maritimibacter sp. DP1N21-5]MBV7410244.1 thermonuclease family protein [Maritimibacter sp. DP1N21-5]
MNAFKAGFVAVAVFCPVSSIAQDGFPGPYYGEVTRVIDGDTFVANVSIWPNIKADISVRIAGIQAPETRRSASCDEEPYYGAQAKFALEQELPVGQSIRLENVRNGSFAGRVIANVFRQNEVRGTPIETLMTRRGLAVDWIPGDDEIDWCEFFLRSAPN